MVRVSLAVFLFVAAGLAGCADDGGDDGSIAPEGVEVPQQQETSKGWIFGLVNGDDGPLAGATVRLDGGASVRTAADGTYELPNLDAGPHGLTFEAEFYDPFSTETDVVAGRGTEHNVGLALDMIAPNVAARDGQLANFVDEDDTLEISVGAPGALTVTTAKTRDRSYYGYWKVDAEQGFYHAYFFVNVSWEPGTVGNELGLRYFRGGALADNEVVNGEADGYHVASDVVASGDDWKLFEIENEDIARWGQQTWQIGVYPASNGAEQPIEVMQPYHIVIDSALLREDAFSG